MKTVRLAALALGCVLVASIASAADEDLATLIQRHIGGDDEARLKVIDVGLPAIPALAEVVATQEGVPAERAARAIGWIVENAGQDAAQRPKAQWALVNLLVDNAQPVPVKAVAAHSLWHVADSQAVAVLSRALSVSELREEVLWSLQHIPGEEALTALSEAYGQGGPEAKAAIVAAVGRRPDAPIEFLCEAASADDMAVRLAGLEALGRTADAAAIPCLERQIRRSSGEALAAALLSYIKIGDALRFSGKLEGAKRVYERTLKWVGDEPQIIAQAVRGLGRSGDADSVAVVAPYLASGSPDVVVAAAGALARLPGQAATEALVSALDGATAATARAVLSALAERADPAAVDAVIPAVRSSNIDLRLAALKALGAMGSPAGCRAIEAAYGAADATEQVKATALQAYLSIGAAQLAAGKTDVARQVYEGVLGVAVDDAARAAALRGLAQVGSPQSFPVIEPFLAAEEAVREAAINAYLAAADALARDGARQAAIDALTSLLARLGDHPATSAIVRRLGELGSSVDLGSRQGFITHWWVIGPFPSDENYAGYDRVFFPEERVDLASEQEFEGKRLAWRHQHSLDPQGIMNYVPLFDRKENAVCYAYAEVSVDEARDARIAAGSDDGLVVWLNGQRVHGINAPRGLKVGQDKVDVRLKGGMNAVLIKVIQGPGDWSSSVQLTDRADQPLAFEQRVQ